MWIGADFCFEAGCKRVVVVPSSLNNTTAATGAKADVVGQNNDEPNYYDAAETN